MSETKRRSLLRRFERPDVSNQGLDIVIAEFISERLHFGLAVVNDAFLDGLGGLVVGEGRLDFGVGQILDPELAPHHGLTFAVLAVTGGAIHVPGRSDVAGRGGPAQRASEQAGHNDRFCKRSHFHFHNLFTKEASRVFVKLNISLSQPPIFRWDFDLPTSRRYSLQLHRAYNLMMKANRATLRLLITTQKLIQV
ncbi:MAG TPA: hypothetical protein VKS19_10000 [Verrucomicrobiae bacterium]|nr:hypothetical protein [Verrucomicrobiae bacterium]